MKQHLRIVLLSIAFFMVNTATHAQQVSTLYFLENAPMRHIINPAFQPISNFYMTFPAIGYTSLWVGNNGLTMSDIVFNNDANQTITALHPTVEGQLWKKLPTMLTVDADVHINLFSFGWRIREKGFAHLNISERAAVGAGIPKAVFGTLLNPDLDNLDLTSLNASASLYTDIAIGYSHIINDQWSVGGKLKFLLGHTYMGGTFDNLNFNSSTDIAHINGSGTIQQAGILKDIVTEQGLNINDPSKAWSYLIPVGYGGAVDLGVTYKPIKNLQITAAVTDLGMIHWTKGNVGTLKIDTTFTGVGDFVYGDYVQNGEFQLDSLTADIGHNLEQYANALQVTNMTDKAFNRMLNANLNIGVDANFWENRVGVGVYSRTRFYNNHISEEITLGAALRPCNWFNFAASYSFLNGKWSNLGAAISIAPYDVFMLTVAADYVPLSYAQEANSGKYIIPYKTKGLNVSVGIAIVAGTNAKRRTIDKDKDGVYDYKDLCLNTPSDIRVDFTGCPIDSDGDGVPDYMDECPNTPSRAYGLIDSVGCPIDSDYDGVPDYLDHCPNTKPEARNYVDETGCILDTDGDGVADYTDQCPGTPAAAYAYLDEYGCPLDSDADGVPDYMDQCPDTPEETQGQVDQYGCPIDSDKDGIVDYLDQCPNTPAVARNHVDSLGCTLDTDGDGVYDYEDLCPTIPGEKGTSGCPEVKREVRTLLTKAMQGIQFENGKATIKKTSYNILNQVAKLFIDNPTYIIEVQGHSDNVGNYQYNIELSTKRAQAVRDYLIKQGVPAERLTAHGYGPDRPIADNNTKEGRTLNRRVEFNITFEETVVVDQ